MGKVQPQRRCVVCRQRKDRSTLWRVTRQPTGAVVLWTQPRQVGRSAYVCREVDCVISALKRESLQRALKIGLPEEVKKQLLEGLEGSVPEPVGGQSMVFEAQ
jgi:predicted RNA-binding protein YlxR (DUF448 family)